MIQIIAIGLTFIYLIRSYRHIMMRSSWYIAILLLLLFLTSNFSTSFISFISSPSAINLSFNGIRTITSTWFSGSTAALTLISLLFIVIKSSRSQVSTTVLTEMTILTMTTSMVLSVNIGFINALPIIIGLALSILVHTYRTRESLIKIIETEGSIPRNLKKNRVVDNLRIILSLTYFLVAVNSISHQNYIGLMSESHLIRTSVILTLLTIFGLSSKTMTRKYIYASFSFFCVYTSIIIASLINLSFEPNLITEAGSLSMNSMTSIALLPFIDIIVSKYYSIANYQRISGIRISSDIFKKFVKWLLIFTATSYIVFIFSY